MEICGFKKWEASLLIALSITLCWSVRVQAQLNTLTENVIRLHVVAVSDDEQEQALKLRVRDAVTALLEPILADCGSHDEAEAAVKGVLSEIEGAACSNSEGRSVSVSFGTESFPERAGDGYSLPAGEYTTLRITLGEGKGHNWWGVVFPQLVPESVDSGKAVEVLGSEGTKLIYGGDEIQVKFRLLEIIKNIID